MRVASDMDIRFVTKTLNCLILSGDVTAEKEQLIFKGVEVFILQAYEYAISHFPVDEPVLLNEAFVQFEDREQSFLAMPQLFAQR